MSQAGSCGRDTPRWSVAGQVARVPPWSMAGLPSAGARVGVGPPLAASGPSRGLAAVRSVGLANAHEMPVSRLYPADSCGAAPAQLGPGAEAAMIEPVTTRSEHGRFSPLELPAIVE